MSRPNLTAVPAPKRPQVRAHCNICRADGPWVDLPPGADWAAKVYELRAEHQRRYHPQPATTSPTRKAA